MLNGKKILIGVTGSIAAYKTAILIRLLVKKGARVKVVMTPLAKQFITPLTLATLSKNPILVDFFDPESGEWNSHVDLGLWADLFLVAPATANTMAKMAHGVADNLLLTTYLSVRCPVFIAPGMDMDMFHHPSTQHNIETLKSYGNIIIDPATGELASGLEGKGRMEEPEKIIEAVNNFFSLRKKDKSSLKKKKLLITAGPTYEAIDPVRFIGNHSSGKMGVALADEACCRGAEVHLVIGPGCVTPGETGVQLYRVTSADDMSKKAAELFEDMDAAIMAAAVSDFTPVEISDKKIKRGKNDLTIRLKPTRDIAAALGKQKTKNQILVGFALETDNEAVNAEKKLKEKNFDFIVLNSLREKSAGFGFDTNKITIIGKRNKYVEFELKTKTEVAVDILDELENYIK